MILEDLSAQIASRMQHLLVVNNLAINHKSCCIITKQNNSTQVRGNVMKTQFGLYQTLIILQSSTKSIIRKYKDYGITESLPKEFSSEPDNQAKRVIIRKATRRLKMILICSGQLLCQNTSICSLWHKPALLRARL
ncbi:hypothetical protein GOODEAATRI_013174 [Goodea atripinnis]|uniref:Uncharacterized protein n=1 Tax=Goodea atripinnis TaxID=208336 RepID=A0ABV0NKT8_9TELE